MGSALPVLPLFQVSASNPYKARLVSTLAGFVVPAVEISQNPGSVVETKALSARFATQHDI